MARSLRQLGESRTVDRILLFPAACICVCSLAATIANAQQGRPRYLLTSSQIVGEMRNRQLQTRGVQVRLAVPITAASENPPLEIQSVAPVSSHEMRLRITCRDRSECLPFFAFATFPEELSLGSLPLMADHQFSGKPQPVSEAKSATATASASPPTRATGPIEPPILRSGSSATLDLDEERVHIRIEVICLEGGAAGDKIRVTSRDRKQVYVARIVTPTLLKGNF